MSTQNNTQKLSVVEMPYIGICEAHGSEDSGQMEQMFAVAVVETAGTPDADVPMTSFRLSWLCKRCANAALLGLHACPEQPEPATVAVELIAQEKRLREEADNRVAAVRNATRADVRREIIDEFYQYAFDCDMPEHADIDAVFDAIAELVSDHVNEDDEVFFPETEWDVTISFHGTARCTITARSREDAERQVEQHQGNAHITVHNTGCVDVDVDDFDIDDIEIEEA